MVEYWDQKSAEEFPTIRDIHYWSLETDYIASQIRSHWEVLDVGCGTGVTTRKYAEKAATVTGVDFSSGMISRAREESAGSGIAFHIMDALSLGFPASLFDCVIMQRCLINLSTWEEQQKAVKEAHRVLKPGGLYIAAEVTLQGHQEVNRWREALGLSPLKVHWHNKYLDESVFLAYLRTLFVNVEAHRFGMYHFLSKVIHPLLVYPEEPAFDSPMNRVAKQVAEKFPGFDKVSHQVIFFGLKGEAKL